MDWNDIRKAGFIAVEGTRYDLAHLADQTYEHLIEAADGRPELRFQTLVQYSSHCVSTGDGELGFADCEPDRLIVDHRGNERRFCENRFALSRNLPGVFESILVRKVSFAKGDNFLVIELTRDGGAPMEYEIYFNVRRESAKYLRLNVETAFVRDDPTKAPDKSANIRAKVLFAKKLRGEVVTRPYK
jgi:hypothetical protein